MMGYMGLLGQASSSPPRWSSVDWPPYMVLIIVRTSYPCFTHPFFKMKTNSLFITIVKCSVCLMSTCSDPLSLPVTWAEILKCLLYLPPYAPFIIESAWFFFPKYIFPLSLLFCNLSCDQLTDYTHTWNILIKFPKCLSNSRLYPICLLPLLKGASPTGLPFTMSLSCSDRNLGVVSPHFLRVGQN